MKSYSAYFVKNRDIDIESVRKIFRHAAPAAGGSWLLGEMRRDAGPPDDEALNGEVSLASPPSETLGEVVFVYGDTSIDGFVYEHAQDGKLLRKLVWFPMLDDDWTAGWICAQGAPEDWETALFRADALERLIERERENYAESGRNGEFPAHEIELRTAWAEGRIEAGRTYPECDGTAALLVERIYGIERD